ncbi:alpha/beta hydrolase [Leisingera aquaemixtae]|uniref:alpha/beta hydrolase n=1 Tax=Leisingera aquaemixtae TaxID=1396826 RepID=UPI0021BD09B8|nr:alpha/beta hydrolase [Leisingera aquaemixtae]
MAIPAGPMLARLLLALLIAGCAVSPVDRLAKPPNLYATGLNYQAEKVPEAQRTVAPRLLYVTNRSQRLNGDGSVTYLAERSDSMAFGAAQVQFTRVQDWPELVALTHADGKGRLPRLKVAGYRDGIRFSKTPLPAERRDGRVVTEARAEREYAAYSAAFRKAVAAEVRRAGTGRILLFVHGFNNDFDDALTTLANIWHYAGRRSVPMMFSWPAGNSGLFKYFRDREAGDFSVFHLKETLDLLASVPEVEDIDIVAHSRGSDLATTALRELVIRERGRGLQPKLTLKTGTLILAAPDIDVGFVRQRLMSERVFAAFEQVNVYINPEDQALALASVLTRESRFGRLDATDFAPGELASLKKVGLVHFIRVEGAGGSGHSYFRDNPGAMSDIALALRTRAFPGGTLRPLELDHDNIWTLHPDYPLDRLPDLDLDFVQERR